jgi:nitrite reductase (NO-forming)
MEAIMRQERDWKRWILAGLILVAAQGVWGAETNLERAPAEYIAAVSITLETGIGKEGMYFKGVGGTIDGQINPTLRVPEGAIVQITMINGDGALHDIVADAFGAKSDQVSGQGASTVITFRADKSGTFVYYCSVPGHRAAGMAGKLVVGEPRAEAAPVAPDISREPTALPKPPAADGSRHHELELEAKELKGRLDDGTEYTYWTFNGTVPGPFLRVRRGDTVDLTLINAGDSRHIHSIDLHAVTGPGGGAEFTQARPGESKSFRFKALQPGLYVYHCATPMVAHHITNGMYGLILVEPEGGLPPVDREFYVMQGEIYTSEPFGKRGQASFSAEKLLAEEPEYFVFNGSVGALSKRHKLRAEVGETVRIYFGVGGPNFTSSFHVIGEIFDRVYDQASLTAAPLTNVQTTLVPAGGATMVEFTLDAPGRYILVDHSLSRMERGLVGVLEVSGEENPEVIAPLRQ